MKSWWRKWRLKKLSSRTATGMVPLKSMHSALLVIDGTCPDCASDAEKLAGFLKNRGISSSLIFIDLRKHTKDNPVYVSGDNVITLRDVNWFGMPRLKKKGKLFRVKADLLVNLRDSDDFTGDFISKVADTRFKIGSCAYEGNPFDLVVTGSGHDRLISERIDEICNFLTRIV